MLRADSRLLVVPYGVRGVYSGQPSARQVRGSLRPHTTDIGERSCKLGQQHQEGKDGGEGSVDPVWWLVLTRGTQRVRWAPSLLPNMGCSDLGGPAQDSTVRTGSGEAGTQLCRPAHRGPWRAKPAGPVPRSSGDLLGQECGVGLGERLLEPSGSRGAPALNICLRVPCPRLEPPNPHTPVQPKAKKAHHRPPSPWKQAQASSSRQDSPTCLCLQPPRPAPNSPSLGTR